MCPWNKQVRREKRTIIIIIFCALALLNISFTVQYKFIKATLLAITLTKIKRPFTKKQISINLYEYNFCTTFVQLFPLSTGRFILCPHFYITLVYTIYIIFINRPQNIFFDAPYLFHITWRLMRCCFSKHFYIIYTCIIEFIHYHQ